MQNILYLQLTFKVIALTYTSVLSFLITHSKSDMRYSSFCFIHINSIHWIVKTGKCNILVVFVILQQPVGPCQWFTGKLVTKRTQILRYNLCPYYLPCVNISPNQWSGISFDSNPKEKCFLNRKPIYIKFGLPVYFLVYWKMVWFIWLNDSTYKEKLVIIFRRFWNWNLTLNWNK